MAEHKDVPFHIPDMFGNTPVGRATITTTDVDGVADVHIQFDPDAVGQAASQFFNVGSMRDISISSEGPDTNITFRKRES